MSDGADKPASATWRPDSPTDARRVYYDHEGAYRRIQAKGGRGWDDLNAADSPDSYDALRAFLASSFCPAEPRGKSALEVGCGGGQASLEIARLGFTTAGIDYAETAIALARENAKEAGLDVRFETGDALTLAGFDDASIDLVVDNHVLHCIIGAVDRASFLRAVFRVLKPGGVFFSETMTADGVWDAARVAADPVTRIALNHTRYWGLRHELDAELTTAGLYIKDCTLRPQTGDDIGVGDMLVYCAMRVC